MKINLVNQEGSGNIYGVSESGGIIRWSCDSCTGCLLFVKVGYDEEISFNEIERNLGEITFDKELIIDSSKSCLLVRVQSDGLSCRKAKYAPAIYGVFACEYSDLSDTLTVYVQSDKANRCVISSSVDYSLVEETRERRDGGFFNRQRVMIRYSTLNIERVSNYRDGSIYYTYDDVDCCYPITAQMLGRPIYLKWYKNTGKPKLKSAIEGIRLKRI